MKKLSLVALVVLLVVALFGVAACSSQGSDDPASESAASSSSVSVEEMVSLKEIKLIPAAEFLEYSSKKTDSSALVECSDKDAKVVANEELDLSKVGMQSVAYSISIGEESAIQEVQFIVRDTKAPTIVFSDSEPSINQGENFDSSNCISSVSDSVDGDLAKVDSEPAAQGSEAGVEQFYDSGWYTVDGTVNSNTPGTYRLVVKASDKHGNVSTKVLRVTVKESAQEVDGEAPAAEKHKYIKSVNSKVFHHENCFHVDDIAEWNRREYYETRDEMVKRGFKPCEDCNP